MISQSVILLSGAILIALSSGTIYVFSAYGPQLAAKFALSSYQLNLLGGAGNAGAYLTGPICGYFVDRHGARSALLGAALFTLAGFTLMLVLFVQPDHITRTFGQSVLKTFVLVLCQFSVGVGCSIGCVGATNAVAKGMKSSSRATALAATYAGVGLSAFLYSTVAHALFQSGSTTALLGLLAIGSFLSMLVGQIMIERSFSKLQYSAVNQNDSDEQDQPEELFTAPRTPQDEEHQRKVSSDSISDRPHHRSPSATRFQELSVEDKPPSGRALDDEVNLSGTALWQNVDFLILFSYGLIVLGTGLLYINNVGTQVTTLFASSSSEEVPPASITSKQAYFVTAISLSNCFGRIAFGAAAEKVQKSALRINRPAWLILSAGCLLMGQLSAKWARSPDDLLLPSLLNGMAYGSFFGLSPVLIVDYFGLKHFSTNYGFLTVAPAVSGPLLSSLFGLVYDSHVSSDAAERHLCLLGHDCYSAAFSLTTVLSLTAMCLAAFLTWRRGFRTDGQADDRPLPEVCAH